MTDAFSLLTGPDPSAATERALIWADETAADGPDSILCLTQTRERADELERRWQDDHNPIRFTATTLDDFVGQCYERATGSLSWSTLSKPDRLRLVEAAIERYDLDDGPFAALEQPSNDLVDQVQGMFSLLEYAGYASPDAIEQALLCAGVDGNEKLDQTLFASFREGTNPDEVGPLSTQATTIAGLYAKYQDLRREIHPDWRTVTSEQYLRLLDDELLVETIPSSVDAVVLDGLTRLAPAEREVVARIARNRPTVAVVPLVHDSMGATGIDLGIERALDVYWAIGFELDYAVPDAVDENRLEAVRSLQVASGDTPAFSTDDVGLEWIEPATEREEVRTTARRVRALLAREDVDPSDIGIVVTDRTTYRGILSETLGSYDVPFTFTNDIGIEQTLVGDAVEALINLADEELRVGPIRTLCSNPLVSLDEFDVDPAEIRRVADRISSDEVDALIDALQDANATETAEGIERLTAAVVPTDDNLGTYVDNLRETFADLRIPDAVDGYGSPDEATGSHRPAYESSAWTSVESVLSSLATIAPYVTAEDPPERVRRALRAELVGGPAQQDGYVRVRPLAEAEMESFDHLFVLGLTAGYFPSEADTMAFFGAVNDADEEFGRAHTGRRARYILGTLLTGAGDVVLSTPQHTVDGGEHVAAPFVTELREYVDAPDGDAAPTRDSPPLVSAEDIQRTFATWASTERFEDPTRATDVLSDTDALSTDAWATAQRGLTAAWRRSGPDLTPHDAQIEPVLDDVFPQSEREPYSPSRLEDYARCPFVFLSKRILGFEEEYGSEEGITRADRGTFIHNVLANFYRRLRETDHQPVDLGRFDRTTLETTLLDAALDQLDHLGDVRTSFARRTMIRLFAGLGSPDANPYYGYDDADVTGLFVRFLDEEVDAHSDGRAQATYFETGIGIDYDDVETLRDDPISLNTPHGTVDVSGIADRVDVATGDTRGIHIRDYKTGSTPARTDVMLGTKLQLPLYGLALETVLEDATGVSHELLGGSYYKLKSPDDIKPLAAQVSSQEAVGESDGPALLPSPYRYWELFDTREEFTQFVRDVTPTRVGKIATAVENGAFHPTLLSEGQANCEDCTFRDACDVRHHHQRDTIADLDEDRHYVSERARGADLDLAAYTTESDD